MKHDKSTPSRCLHPAGYAPNVGDQFVSKASRWTNPRSGRVIQSASQTVIVTKVTDHEVIYAHDGKEHSLPIKDFIRMASGAIDKGARFTPGHNVEARHGER